MGFSLPFPSLTPTPLSPTITVVGQHQNRTTTTTARSLRSPSTYSRSEFGQKLLPNAANQLVSLREFSFPPPFVALPPRRKLPAAYLDFVEAF